MAYDPLRYVNRSGDYAAAAISGAGQALQQLPETLMKMESWRKFKAGEKNDLQAKQKYLEGAKKLLQEIGADPSAIPFDDPANANLTVEQFAEKIAGTIKPFVESAPGEKLQQLAVSSGLGSLPNMESAYQKQSYLQGSGYFDKQSEAAAPQAPQEPADPLPATMPGQESPEQLSELDSILSGTWSPQAQQQAAPPPMQAPQISPSPVQDDPLSALRQRFESINQDIDQQVASGILGPTEATKLKQQTTVELAKLEYDERKSMADEQRKRTQSGEDANVQALMTVAAAGGMLYEKQDDGSWLVKMPADPTAVRAHPENYAFTAPETGTGAGRGTSKGGSRGSAEDDGADKAAWKDLQSNYQAALNTYTQLSTENKEYATQFPDVVSAAKKNVDRLDLTKQIWTAARANGMELDVPAAEVQARRIIDSGMAAFATTKEGRPDPSPLYFPTPQSGSAPTFLSPETAGKPLVLNLNGSFNGVPISSALGTINANTGQFYTPQEIIQAITNSLSSATKTNFDNLGQGGVYAPSRP